jgi:hypothetical protein
MEQQLRITAISNGPQFGITLYTESTKIQIRREVRENICESEMKTVNDGK